MRKKGLQTDISMRDGHCDQDLYSTIIVHGASQFPFHILTTILLDRLGWATNRSSLISDLGSGPKLVSELNGWPEIRTQVSAVLVWHTHHNTLHYAEKPAITFEMYLPNLQHHNQTKDFSVDDNIAQE